MLPPRHRIHEGRRPQWNQTSDTRKGFHQSGIRDGHLGQTGRLLWPPELTILHPPTVGGVVLVSTSCVTCRPQLGGPRITESLEPKNHLSQSSLKNHLSQSSLEATDIYTSRHAFFFEARSYGHIHIKTHLFSSNLHTPIIRSSLGPLM